MRAMRVSCLVLLCLMAFSTAATAERTDKRPNVIFIMTDNHGAWSLGCYGNPDVKTPHIDSLAQQGTLFERAYANNAVCSPTRATLLTGLMPCQHGVHCFLRANNAQIGPDAYYTLEEFDTLPQLLHESGYVCGLSGKWHLGDNLHPQDGCSYWVTKPHGGSQGFYDQQIIENEKIRVEPQYLTDFWTDHGIRFIEQNKDRPFFLMLTYNGPYGLGGAIDEPIRNRHLETYGDAELPSFPRTKPEPWNFNYGDRIGDLPTIRKYAAEISGIDDGVGRILKTLKRLNLSEDTLIVFTADQGLAGGHSGYWGMGDHTRPLTAFDWTIHVPLIYKLPGKITAGQRVEQVVDHTDFLPTMCQLLDLKRPEGLPGRGYARMLKGEWDGTWDDTVYYEFENVRAIRTPERKYIERIHQSPNELYDLAKDPGETKNLIDDPAYAVDVVELREQLHAQFKEIANPKWDLWNGGGSKSYLMMSKLFEEAKAKKTSEVDVEAADDVFTPAPLQVPDGYTVELAAAPPLVAHPLMGDFDEQGRLYLAANAGENLRRPELEEKMPNFVQRLEDVDGDGVFDKAITFADRMTFPQGCLWHHGSLYVASSGAIWKLTDTDDDDVADERVKLVGDFGYTGNAADVHGPFLGPEGRIYWCEGRHGHEITDADGNLISKGKAARIFSCLPDGSDVQTYCMGGMDNPVEVVFTPEGEMLGTVNLMYSKPRGDCLVNWQYGGIYPREDFAEGLGGEFIRTGDLLQEVHNFGHVAVSGLCRVRGDRLGAGFDGSIFVTQFNTNRISRVTLKPEASSYAVDTIEDFAISSSKDFRPTDVLEAPDGSLLVIDTGGWFRIGCPQSQVAKSHIQGAIYRIRKTSPTEVAVATTHNEASPEVKKATIWHLRKTAVSELMTQLPTFLNDDNSSVRQTAIRSLLDVPWSQAQTLKPKLIDRLQNGEPAERRVAALVLGRRAVQDPTLLPTLVEALARPENDRLIRHGLILGLINANDRKRLSELLIDPRPGVSSAAAIALEQLRRPQVNPDNQNWLEIPAASLGKPLSDEDRNRLLTVEQTLPNGDLNHGRTIFEGTKAACNKCHRVSGNGGQVGPDLSTIGKSRSRRDLLEAILYPSASFVRGFAPYTVLTEDGKTASGIILGEGPEELHIGIDKEKSTRVRNETVEEIIPSNTSIMPEDVHRMLSPQDLADLIVYLESLGADPQQTTRTSR